jgi:hypothetical protein
VSSVTVECKESPQPYRSGTPRLTGLPCGYRRYKINKGRYLTPKVGFPRGGLGGLGHSEESEHTRQTTLGCKLLRGRSVKTIRSRNEKGRTFQKLSTKMPSRKWPQKDPVQASITAVGARARNAGDRDVRAGASSAWGRASALTSASRARARNAGDRSYASITAKGARCKEWRGRVLALTSAPRAAARTDDASTALP